jgi:hypothetical protein
LVLGLFPRTVCGPFAEKYKGKRKLAAVESRSRLRVSSGVDISLFSFWRFAFRAGPLDIYVWILFYEYSVSGVIRKEKKIKKKCRVRNKQVGR